MRNGKSNQLLQLRYHDLRGEGRQYIQPSGHSCIPKPEFLTLKEDIDKPFTTLFIFILSIFIAPFPPKSRYNLFPSTLKVMHTHNKESRKQKIVVKIRLLIICIWHISFQTSYVCNFFLKNGITLFILLHRPFYLAVDNGHLSISSDLQHYVMAISIPSVVFMICFSNLLLTNRMVPQFLS